PLPFSSFVVVSFSSRYGASRNLPSFPTRRSSDLLMHLAVIARVLGVLLMIFSLTLLVPIAVSLWFNDNNYMTFLWGFAFAFGAGDRKSTRLNSSHVKISYAVFCLKKKNNTKYSQY